MKRTLNVNINRSEIPGLPPPLPPGELIAEVENREERCLKAASSVPSGGGKIPQNEEL